MHPRSCHPHAGTPTRPKRRDGRALIDTLTLVVGALLTACSGGTGAPLELKDGDTVKVASIIKGDEVLVARDGQQSRVRILGIHAFAAVVNDPQVEALSAGAVAALEGMLESADVKVSFDKTVKDESGRYLAYLEKAGDDVGRKMVADGWAVVYTEFAFAREGAYLEDEARARGAARNVWGLKPAAGLVHGLREQWRTSRHAGGGPALVDPLLSAAAPAPDPATAPSPAPTPTP